MRQTVNDWVQKRSRNGNIKRQCRSSTSSNEPPGAVCWETPKSRLPKTSGSVAFCLQPPPPPLHLPPPATAFMLPCRSSRETARQQVLSQLKCSGGSKAWWEMCIRACVLFVRGGCLLVALVSVPCLAFSSWELQLYIYIYEGQIDLWWEIQQKSC